MLIVDWFGCLLTGCVLALLLPGPNRLLRALTTMLLGELGRVALVLLGGGAVAKVTVAGAFTQLDTEGLPVLLVRLGGLFLASLLGLLAGRRTSRDLLLYALYTALATLLLPGWETAWAAGTRSPAR